MPPFRYELLDFGGGVNDGIPPTLIAEREFTDLLNLYPYGPKLARRPGVSRVTNSLGAELVSVARYYDRATNQAVLLAGGLATLYYYSGLSFVAALTSSASSRYPWRVRQYNDIAYVTRRDLGGLYWARPSLPDATGTKVVGAQAAGIAAPTTAPTISDGGAGALDAGDFVAGYTFYDPDTGAESDPSPVSNTLTLAGSKSVSYSGLEVSTNSRVTQRRFYRSLPDLPGVYYLVGTDSNTGTTYGPEDATRDEMGAAASFRNGMPPSGVTFMEFHKEHLWVTDGRDLYYSEPGLPDAFHALNLLPVSPDDAGRIEGMVSTPAGLLVGKTTGLWLVTGESRANWEVRLVSSRHGCVSGESMVWSNGVAYYLGEREVYAVQDGGGTPTPIGSPRLRQFLERVDPAYHATVTATIYEPMGWLMFSFPDTGADADDWPDRKRTMVYSLRTNAWFPWRWDASGISGTVTYRALRGAVSFTAQDGTPQLYGILDGLTYVYDLLGSAGLDQSAPSYEDQVNWALKSKRLVSQEQHGFLQGIIRVGMLPGASWPAAEAFSVYAVDDAGGDAAFRSWTPEAGAGWQWLNIQGARTLSSAAQVRFEGASTRQFEIEGLILECVRQERRRRAA